VSQIKILKFKHLKSVTFQKNLSLYVFQGAKSLANPYFTLTLSLEEHVNKNHIFSLAAAGAPLFYGFFIAATLRASVMGHSYFMPFYVLVTVFLCTKIAC
jgi:hypothetical protein